MIGYRFYLTVLLILLVAVEVESLKSLRQNHKFLKNDDLDGFRQAQLDRHNKYRRLHGVPLLELDDQLNDIAQSYAQELAQRDVMEHSHHQGLGENLYTAWARPPRPYTYGAATDAWYDEIKLYNFNRPGFSSGTGHFTQVIWADSQRVGFGIATSEQGSDYVVANYDPPGNFDTGNDDYRVNVPRAGQSPSKDDQSNNRSSGRFNGNSGTNYNSNIQEGDQQDNLWDYDDYYYGDEDDQDEEYYWHKSNNVK